MYIIKTEYRTEIIPVSFYSLNSELSFDTQHFVFIHFRNGLNIKLDIFHTSKTSRGHKRSNLRWR